MPRNRRAALRRLTFEQQAVMTSMGILLYGEEGESNLDTAVRIFGSAEAARAAWDGHREAALAADRSPGRRPPFWWLFDRGMDPPRVGEEEALLRELGFLTPDEESQLEEWRRRMRRMPEVPRDLGLDHVAIDPIPETSSATPPMTPSNLEDPDHAISAPPEPPRPAVTEAAGGSGAPTEDPDVEDPAEEHEQPEENVVILPQTPHAPWWQNVGPNPNEGWE
jgi:hypothetical protein